MGSGMSKPKRDVVHTEAAGSSSAQSPTEAPSQAAHLKSTAVDDNIPDWELLEDNVSEEEEVMEEEAFNFVPSDLKDSDSTSDDADDSETRKKSLNEEDARRELEGLMIKYDQLFRETYDMCQRKPKFPHKQAIDEFNNALILVYESAHEVKERLVTAQIKSEYKRKLSERFVESGLAACVCDIAWEIIENEQYCNKGDDDKDSPLYALMLEISLAALMSFTDWSHLVARIVRCHGKLLPILVRKLDELFSARKDKSLTEIQTEIVWRSLSIIHNVDLYDENVPFVREIPGVLGTLNNYFNLEDDDIQRLIAMLTIADLATDENRDQLAAPAQIIASLLAILQEALQSKDNFALRGAIVFEAHELLRAVKHLSRNDGNKLMMVNNNALLILKEGLISDGKEERRGCMECLWWLSFLKDNHQAIIDTPDLLPRVINMFHGKDEPSPQDNAATAKEDGLPGENSNTTKEDGLPGERSNTTSDETQREKGDTTDVEEGKKGTPDLCRVAAEGLLLQLKDLLASHENEEYRQLAKQLTPTEEPETPSNHVMLSYNRASRPVVHMVYKFLCQNNIKVWMDIYDMSKGEGSTLQTMALAVKGAGVFVMCVSEGYDASAYCRAEAEMAFEERKTIIPISEKKGFKGHDWLKIILGSKFIYDFSLEEKYKESLEKLLEKIKSITAAGDCVDGRNIVERPVPAVEENPIVAESAHSGFVYGAPKSTIQEPKQPADVNKIKNWTKDDVEKWLTTFELKGKKLRTLRGKDIAFLCQMKMEAPQYFYQVLGSPLLQLRTVSEMANFAFALEEAHTMQ